MSDLIRFSEKLFFVLLSIWTFTRLGPAVPEHPAVLLFLISELVAVAFILTQRKGTWSSSPYAATIAFVGTAAPLFVEAEGVALAPDAVSLLLTFLGGAIALFGKLSLRRSFGLVAANRGVKTGGLYAFVRHPIYCGYIINHCGLLLVYASAFNVAVIALAWTMLWLRACEEERFLLTDPAYSDYAGKVRHRLIPGLL